MSALIPPPLWQRLLPTLVTAGGVVAGLGLFSWLVTRWLRRIAGGARHLAGPIRRTLQAVGTAAVALVLVRGAGVGVGQLSWREVADWALGPGLRIVFIFAGAYILVRIVGFFIDHMQLALSAPEAEGLDWAERRKRIQTLGRLMRGLTGVVIVGMATLMALREVNIDITPILTGAGVAGVALGFGAQTVVKDLIAGAFLILENQIRVGDVITVNGKTGLVESIRLRILLLRGLDGAVYIFQNGAVTEIANLTKDYAYAMLAVGVAYKEDLDRVRAALEAVGRELRASPEFGARVLEPMEILGVDSLAGTGVGIKARIKTAPMQQWAVERELRRRVKARFDQDGIAVV